MKSSFAAVGWSVVVWCGNGLASQEAGPPEAATEAASPGNQSSQAASPSIPELVDAALASHWQELSLSPTPIVDDAAFLRRLSIDLLGTIPSREEVEQFLEEKSPEKRSLKIDEYLGDPAFAENLSIVWSNLLLSGAQSGPERVALRPWLEESFAANLSLSDIVRDLVGGRGRSDENGAVGFALSYERDIEALSAVTAKSFLGLQIQCAQCHDHPYDRWKQDEFNGFASFFALMRANRVDPGGGGTPPVFRLVDVPSSEQREDELGRIRSFLKKMQGELEVEEAEENRDAGEDMEEMQGESMDVAMRRERAMKLLRELRKLKDGPLPEQDIESFVSSLPPEVGQRIRDEREKRQKFSAPRYLDGMEYQENDLLSRREALAEWIADPDNPYFGPAIVNRVWKQLFGVALTEPVDDLTGSTDIVLAELLDTLGQRFVADGTDLRALIGALVRTRAYSLAAGTVPAGEARTLQERHFAAHPVRPLSAEQVLHALLRATQSEEFVQNRRSRGEPFERVRQRLLEQFKYVFSDDEAGEGDSFSAGIPQALFLMNGKFTNETISIRRSPMLEDILGETRSEEKRIEQIFYATLSRGPTSKEKSRLSTLVRLSGKKGSGLEDLFWSLLNSSEFISNH